LPIERNAEGRPEIHYTRIYRALRRRQADGCIDAIFAGSVRKLHQDGLLELTVIHGDGTTAAAKKDGDNLHWRRARRSCSSGCTRRACVCLLSGWYPHRAGDQLDDRAHRPASRFCTAACADIPGLRGTWTG